MSNGACASIGGFIISAFFSQAVIAVSIDFEDGVSNAAIDAFYADHGVTFSQAKWRDLGQIVPGISGTFVLRHLQANLLPKMNDPIVGVFTGAAASMVSINAVDVGGNGARIDAYDSVSGGIQLATDMALDTGNTFDTLTVSASGIVRFELYQPLSDFDPFDGVEWDDLSFILPGDFDDDGLVNEADIDQLRSAIDMMQSDPRFDVNGAGGNVPDAADFDFLISNILNTGHGDADLNRVVNFDDFVVIANQFGNNGTGWGGGNFNLDFSTNFSDFVLLSNNFGMDFTAHDTLVPEPAAQWLLIAASSALLAPRRHRPNHESTPIRSQTDP